MVRRLRHRLVRLARDDPARHVGGRRCLYGSGRRVVADPRPCAGALVVGDALRLWPWHAVDRLAARARARRGARAVSRPERNALERGGEGRFAYSGLERIFHERGRLAVCTCLIAHPEGMSFSDLQRACGLTDGNLSRHLQALSEMKIVSLERRVNNGRPTTTCTVTRTGRARFLAYVDVLEAVVRDVQRGAAKESGARTRSTVPGLATT
ncbi:hypothetical protein EPN44_03730 [bacterium]|nr:MAG: hypothetical protein EPN44_03730 [bacterium]